MQYRITLTVEAEGDIQAHRLASHFLKSDMVKHVAIEADNGRKVSEKGVTFTREKVTVNLKVFSSNDGMIKTCFSYYSDGKIVKTEPVGTPRGEDITIDCDCGTLLTLRSTEGDTYFSTDHTFEKKLSYKGSSFSVEIPERYGRAMFLVDSHYGRYGEKKTDLCCAYGVLEGALTLTGEKMAV